MKPAFRYSLALIFCFGLFGTAMTGCEEDTALEDAAEEVEDGAEDVADELKDGAEDVKDETEDALN